MIAIDLPLNLLILSSMDFILLLSPLIEPLRRLPPLDPLFVLFLVINTTLFFLTFFLRNSVFPFILRMSSLASWNLLIQSNRSKVFNSNNYNSRIDIFSLYE